MERVAHEQHAPAAAPAKPPRDLRHARVCIGTGGEWNHGSVRHTDSDQVFPPDFRFTQRIAGADTAGTSAASRPAKIAVIFAAISVGTR